MSSVFTHDAFLMSFNEDMIFHHGATIAVNSNYHLYSPMSSESSEEELISPVSNSSTDSFIYPSEYQVLNIDDDHDEDYDTERKPRKINISSARKATTKVRRNERERRRVRKLSDGFAKLKTVIPGNRKKLSKLDTLKNAVEYINNLATMLTAHDVETESDSYKLIHKTNESVVLCKQEIL